ncbi:MAG: GntR family transcriptional regulator [Clostridia bacterium]|nr:GntR family transcriptional regulator [Clostridia bacterium]
MDFSGLKLNGDEPVYIQLATHVKRAVAAGTVQDGETLPSRREVAARLGVNPNTVQKAFRLMEEEGYIVTPPNAASSLRLTPEIMARIQAELSEEFVRGFVKKARQNKLSQAQLIALIQKYWEDTACDTTN